MQLIDAIPQGRENAVTRAELLALTGLSDRGLRRELHDLRLSGELICSSTTPPGGFWRPDDEGELRAFLTSMTNRGKNTLAAASATRRALRDFEEANRA